MAKQPKNTYFSARVDRYTEFGLAVLSKLAGKTKSALLRDMVAKELAALPSKTTGEGRS